MKGYENYERACRSINIPYDDNIKRFIRFLEFDGYTEKGICNAFGIGRNKLRKHKKKEDFYDVLLSCVKEYAWDDDDPRYDLYEARKEKYEQKQADKKEFKEKILNKSYAPGKMTGFIYFLQSETNDRIKIGYTVDIHNRIQGLQTEKKDKLVLLLMVPGNFGYETFLHKMFKQHNIEGEWFNPDPEILEYMDNLKELDKADTAREIMLRRAMARKLDQQVVIMKYEG